MFLEFIKPAATNSELLHLLCKCNMRNLYVIFPSIFFFSYREDQLRLQQEEVLVVRSFIRNAEKLHAQTSWGERRDQKKIYYQATIFRTCGPGSILHIATGYGLDGPGIESRWGAKFYAPVQTGPGVHPASCTMGSFPGIKSGRGVTLTPHHILVLWSWKGRAIPLLPLWAVRPVQSLSACTRVTFTFSFIRRTCILRVPRTITVDLTKVVNEAKPLMCSEKRL